MYKNLFVTILKKYVRLWSTYTAFVCVERLCVRITFNFCDVQCGMSWGIQFGGLFDLLLSLWTLVIRWKSQWFNLEGSVASFFRVIYWLFLDRLKDLNLRVLSASFISQAAHNYLTVSRIQYLGSRWVIFPTICLRFTVRSYLEGFLLIFIEQYIYPDRVILLCTMLLCGIYNIGTKDTLGIVIIS